MLTPIRSRKFDKDVELARKRGYDLKKLKSILDLLINEQPLPIHCRDHQFKGDWKGFRNAHIEPDWLLIYAVEDGELHLARTGTHADISAELLIIFFPGRLSESPFQKLPGPVTGVAGNSEGRFTQG